MHEDLLQYEDMMISDHFKFGVLYRGPNQLTEDEMYNNSYVSDNILFDCSG